MKVRDMMNGVLFHVDISSNIKNVARLLFDNNGDAVLVRKNGVPVGVITAMEIVGCIRRGLDPEKTLAKDIMQTSLNTVDHDDEITTARQKMMQNRAKHLLVKQNVDIIGMLVPDDLIRNRSY